MRSISGMLDGVYVVIFVSWLFFRGDLWFTVFFCSKCISAGFCSILEDPSSNHAALAPGGNRKGTTVVEYNQMLWWSCLHIRDTSVSVHHCKYLNTHQLILMTLLVSLLFICSPHACYVHIFEFPYVTPHVCNITHITIRLISSKLPIFLHLVYRRKASTSNFGSF